MGSAPAREREPYRASDQATTDRRGEYHFDNLLPDSYFVSAAPEFSNGRIRLRQVAVDAEGRPTTLRELRTFYPSTLSIAAAQKIQIGPGQEQTGVDIRVQRGRLLRVTGRIADGSAKQGYSVSASLNEGMGWSSQTAKILPDGSFVFEELPPGEHRLALFKSGTNGPEEIGATEIYLGNENVNGVVLTPFTPATVSVRVMQEGSRRPLTVGSVSLGPNEENGSVGRGVYRVEPQNGIYIFHGLLPGKYQINFTNHGSPISNL